MNKKFFTIAFVLLFSLIAQQLTAQTPKKYFSGIYTIGGNNANYQTIQRALTDLLASNSEVIGRVTFNIRPGVYEENLVLKPYNGASAKNFVVFKSETGKASDVLIVDEGDNTLYNNQVIRFEGCSYYTLQDLTIENSKNITASNQFASVIHFTYNRDTKKPSEFNTITRCVLKLDSNFTIFNGNTIGIVSSDINNTSIGENCANYNTISNNTIYGGAFGIKLTGKSYAVPSKGNKIVGNKFYKCYSAIDLDFNNVPLMASNQIFCRVDSIGSQFGIRVRNSSGNFSYHSNTIKDFGTFGMFFYNVNGGAASYIYNNIILGSSKSAYSRGIHVEFSKSLHFYYNSIYYTAPFSLDNACMVIEHSGSLPTSKINVKNNIFYTKGGATTFILRDLSSVDSMNFNDYYNAHTVLPASLAIIGATSRATLATIKSSTGKNQNSFVEDPVFTSPTNLRIDSRKLIRKAYILPFILTDFENQPRDPEMPDVGADEVIRSAVDLEVFGLDKNFVPREGNNILPVVIKNDGLLSLNGNKILLSYRIDNGSFTTPEEYTLQTLSKSYSKQVINMATPWNVPAPGQYVLTIRVTPPVPNDTWQENDSIRLNICVGLNGTYTIGGPAGPKNYVGFADAIAAFGCGIGGPTTFNVYPGTYANFTVPQIKGVSETNTLTFRSITGVASDVVIQNNTAAQNHTNHYVVQLDGADYVIFKNFTLNNTSTSTFASGFHVTEGSNNITVDSCVITVPSSTNVTDLKFPIILSQKVKIDSGIVANNFTVKNSILRYGVVGIQFLGRNTPIKGQNISAVGNTIDSSYLYGIYSNFMNVGELSYNKICLKDNSNQGSEGIRMQYSKYNSIINGNKITNIGLRGLNLTSVEGVVTVTISNNMISKFKTNQNGSGIFFNEVNKVTLYHNSVYYDKSSIAAPNTSSAFFLAAGSNVSLYNNIFYNSGNGYAFYVTSTSSVRNSNNNIYYTDGNPGTNFYAFWSADRADLTALKNAMQGLESRSLEINPNFISVDDLHTSNTLLEGKGLFFANVPLDIDKQQRNPLYTDIGADEFIIHNKDLIVKDIRPLVFGTDPNTISVELMNLGSSSLAGSAIKLQFSSDGTSWLPAGGESYNIGASLASPYSKDVFTFTTKFNATANTTYQFYVRVMPSDRVVGDGISSNDTAFNVICTGLKSGTYTIGGAGADYPDFTTAANAISCGVTGPVVFNVRPGIYNERFTINNPRNTSAINMITFKAENNDSTSVIINSNGVSANTTRNVIRLNRAKFINFKHLTIRNRSNNLIGTSVVQITSESSDINITNCRIEMSGTTTSPNVFGITTSDSALLSNGGRAGKNINISHNYISGGNVAIAIKGTSQYIRDEGYTINHNFIDSASNYGILTSSADITSISNNVIAMRKEQITSTGLAVSICKTDAIIMNNKIYNAASVGVAFNDVITINGILFANNMIGGNFRLGTDGAGISLTKVFPIKVYYNSVLYDGNSVFGAGLKIDNDSRGVRLLNNSIANNNNGFCFNLTNFLSIDTSDNNNYFTKGTLFARVGAADYASFEEFRDATLTDEKTVSVDPDYFTNTNLHITNTFLDGGALLIKEVTTDIDGEDRNSEFPDIGADDFLIKGDIEVVSIDNPLPSPEIYPSSIPVQITVRNKGLSKISGLNVKFFVDNVEIANEVIPVEEPYKPLLPSDLITYDFQTMIEPVATGTYTLRVEAYLPDDIDLTNNDKSIQFKSSISSIMDGEVNAFITPANSSVTKETEVKVLIKNAGTVVIKQFTVNYKLRGGVNPPTYVSQVYSGDSIMPLATSAFTFDTKINCEGVYDRFLDVYITDLDDDINQLNDTLSMYVKPYSGCGQVDGVEFITKDLMLTQPWPNPTSSTINYDVNVFDLTDMQIEIIDVLGHVLKSVNYNQLTEGVNHLNIDVQDLAPGVYYSRVSAGGQSHTNRVVITR